MEVTSRLAKPQDEPFLRELYFEVRSPEFELAKLSRRQLQQMLANQFDARRNHYERVFPNAVYWVLEQDGNAVGYEVIVDGVEINLIDIAVLPKYQNQGIFSAQMKALLEDAEIRGKSVILSVEIFNPARRLLERLGFEDYEDYGVYKRMRWSASRVAFSNVSLE